MEDDAGEGNKPYLDIFENNNIINSFSIIKMKKRIILAAAGLAVAFLPMGVRDEKKPEEKSPAPAITVPPTSTPGSNSQQNDDVINPPLRINSSNNGQDSKKNNDKDIREVIQRIESNVILCRSRETVELIRLQGELTECGTMLSGLKLRCAEENERRGIKRELDCDSADIHEITTEEDQRNLAACNDLIRDWREANQYEKRRENINNCLSGELNENDYNQSQAVFMQKLKGQAEKLLLNLDGAFSADDITLPFGTSVEDFSSLMVEMLITLENIMILAPEDKLEGLKSTLADLAHVFHAGLTRISNENGISIEGNLEKNLNKIATILEQATASTEAEEEDE